MTPTGSSRGTGRGLFDDDGPVGERRSSVNSLHCYRAAFGPQLINYVMGSTRSRRNTTPRVPLDANDPMEKQLLHDRRVTRYRESRRILSRWILKVRAFQSRWRFERRMGEGGAHIPQTKCREDPCACRC